MSAYIKQFKKSPHLFKPKYNRFIQKEKRQSVISKFNCLLREKIPYDQKGSERKNGWNKVSRVKCTYP